ncbi:FHA domain-containing protein [Altericista sp. CCNU0014]|uniref:FHA domain-containing protein n=1 Tax=Altericista sp. CCNU0014 TaxID=3082949 RepID=UPI00384A67EC
MATICPICLFSNLPNASACSRCGKSLSRIQKCTACSATIFAFSHFCYQCGVPVVPRDVETLENTADLDSSPDMVTGDILDLDNEESATTFYRHGVKLLHRPSSVFYDLPLVSSPISIGKRSDGFVPDLDLRDLPESEFISRSHAQISFSPQEFYIEDLGSKNGTALNGVPLPARQPQSLAFGDALCFGGVDAFNFVFIKDRPINLDHLQTISGHDRAFELELLTSYLESVRGLLEDLQATLDRGDFAAVKPMAIQVAIASYNVGADIMNLLAKQLEDRALQQAASVCEKTLGSMQDGLVQVDRFMKAFYGT